MTHNSMEEIHTLWDEMAAFEAKDDDQALRHLLTTLCGRVDGCNACWIVGVRMPNIVHGDPAKGWRPRLAGYLEEPPGLVKAGREQERRLESGDIDLTTVRNIALAGQWRANRLVDLVGPEWFDSDYYQRFYRGVGHGDAIWAGCPVNSDAELYFGIFRDTAKRRFTPADRDRVAAALRGLKWFYRRYLLGHGLLVAEKALTPAERRVLQQVLDGKTEKEMAEQLFQSRHTTRNHMKEIYRKFGVGNRASLMALWLGKGV